MVCSAVCLCVPLLLVSRGGELGGGRIRGPPPPVTATCCYFQQTNVKEPPIGVGDKRIDAVDWGCELTVEQVLFSLRAVLELRCHHLQTLEGLGGGGGQGKRQVLRAPLGPVHQEQFHHGPAVHALQARSHTMDCRQEKTMSTGKAAHKCIK